LRSNSDTKKEKILALFSNFFSSCSGGFVVVVTRSSLLMMNHLAQGLSVAAIPALVLLNAKFSPLPAQSLEANMFCIYTVSTVAVFWPDIESAVLHGNLRTPFRFFGTSALTENMDTTTLAPPAPLPVPLPAPTRGTVSGTKFRKKKMPIPLPHRHLKFNSLAEPGSRYNGEQRVCSGDPQRDPTGSICVT
jgi:hypothetical protein